MSTNLWATLTVALALWAIVGWWLARFFDREALHEHRVALLVGGWLGKEQAKRAKIEAEARELKRTVARPRWRVRYPSCRDDEFLNLEACVFFMKIEQGKEHDNLVFDFKRLAKKIVREWQKDRAESNWGKYLRHEREIREKAGVSNSAKDKDRVV
jgi:hypothetical protein